MAPDHTTNGIHPTNYSKTCRTSTSKPTDGLTERRGEVHKPSPYLATDRCFPFLIVWMAFCFPRRRQHLRDFFFFTWESQTTSGPMLGYRPNNCTTELLIQWSPNASMHVSFVYRCYKCDVMFAMAITNRQTYFGWWAYIFVWIKTHWLHRGQFTCYMLSSYSKQMQTVYDQGLFRKCKRME